MHNQIPKKLTKKSAQPAVKGRVKKGYIQKKNSSNMKRLSKSNRGR